MFTALASCSAQKGGEHECCARGIQFQDKRIRKPETVDAGVECAGGGRKVAGAREASHMGLSCQIDGDTPASLPAGTTNERRVCERRAIWIELRDERVTVVASAESGVKSSAGG